MTALPSELRLFHLPAGKKGPPLVRRFYDLAVPANDFEPGENNIGVSTTGLLVPDIDAQKGGFDTLATLEMLYEPLPVTLVVGTPRGGQHRYFKAPHPIANSAEKLGPGFDIRGHHGYVVGAGSVTAASDNSAAGEYRVLVDAPIAEAPQWLVDLCEKPRERELTSDVPVENLDQPHNVQRAIAYLEQADPAVQGAGGNDHTYRTAAAVIDFGLSRGKAVETMAGWNDRCSPPWAPEELERMVDNAARYRTGAVGKSDPRTEFDEYRAPPSGIEPRPYAPRDIAPKPRQWLMERTAIRGKLSLLVAPPGAGKSTMTIAAAISIALGKDLLGIKVVERANVWLYNNEDDLEELYRRIDGVLSAHNLKREDLDGKLFVNSGEHIPLVIAKRTPTGVRKSQQCEELAGFIEKNRIGLTIVDPLSETHEGDENDNVQMRQVATFFREVAQKTNSAIVLVHHTRKLPAGSSEGHAGNMDSGRGASSVSGVARVILTLMPASEKDAKRHGIPATQRHEYVRLDYAKGTFSASLGRPLWFRWESVPSLAWTAENNDRVGVLKPVELGEAGREINEFDRLVIEVCGEGCRRSDLIGRLADHPMMVGKSRDAIRKLLDREAKITSAWQAVSDDSGAPDSVRIVPVKTTETTVNEADEADAEVSGRSGRQADDPLEFL